MVPHSTLRGTNAAVAHSNAGQFRTAALPQALRGELRSATFARWLMRKWFGEVPTLLRQEVFREYGIVNARADDYEIDFLIAPGLGGTEDIHNLWPEPYTSPTWNAHVKDALEEHLHQLVCAGS